MFAIIVVQSSNWLLFVFVGTWAYRRVVLDATA